MADITTELKQIARFSDPYRRNHLESPEETYSDDDPFRLRLFLKKGTAGARSQSINVSYRKAAESVLRANESEIEARLQDGTGITDEQLLDKLEQAGINNQHDRQMVVGTIDYLEGLADYEYDIIDYTIAEIQAGRIAEVYDEVTDVHNFGPKKATLYLRDIVAIWELEGAVEGMEYRYVFPIDTWVHRVASHLGIVDTDSPNWARNSRSVVEACGTTISPIEFNQGAWYVGANAFEILMENLETLEP